VNRPDDRHPRPAGPRTLLGCQAVEEPVSLEEGRSSKDVLFVEVDQSADDLVSRAPAGFRRHLAQRAEFQGA